MSSSSGSGQEVIVDDSTDEETPSPPVDKFLSIARADEVLELWRTKQAEGILTQSHFQDHWRVTVPRMYSPHPNRSCLDWSFDENLGVRLLIQPLEQFIWGTKNGEQPVITRRPTLCGRVFKQGEPAYSCRECGMDNTCVLCVECFKVSPHRHHKYKMGQSGGGGCCDCGDPEAWKKDVFCELHTAQDNKSDEPEGIRKDVIERMQIVASVVLSYCFRLLTLDHAPDLPNELRLKDAERDPLQILDHPDIYCTVLYNDETHTFEQVIMTLTRVMKCDHRDSVELVTLVDREGRALIKCSSFQVCDKLKNDIETYTSQHGPTLKVLVMHAHVAAHQMFAMKLLQWLQNFVNHEVGLRVAVSSTILGENTTSNNVIGGSVVANGVMQNDCNMWKAARTAWHRLLLATTLMDYESKKALSILFTKNYASVMKDFIYDDHDHSFSVSSLSVQLFTTPTLAHYLVAKHDAFYIVLNTFVSECIRRCNAKGRLEFVRDHTLSAFKRSQFVLYDVKYLLSSMPTNWEDDLRKGFLHGLQLLLNLLAMMQGMDSVVRQIGQHMEYEPEWESAFNLHVKLAHSITLALEWCSSDRTLTAKAYRMALRKLMDIEKFTEPYVRVQKLCPPAWDDIAVIPYDVSTKPVSIHQPLSRFIAGLHLILDKHGFSYHSKEFEWPDRLKPPPEQLIEPILRTAVMMAQVHAGMWRRNGFALLNQLYFYHNVKCRSEMLDRDIVMLQVGASLIESNEYMVHLLNKFNLLDWVTHDFESRITDEDFIRHVTNLIEEFLGLLITIVGSRYVPGVGEVSQDERTKKEIIQMLCVKPMPHSELNRCLPEDQVHETGLEAVIDDVADFNKKGPGNLRGKYTLKSHLYEEYDTFFYHYTREDLSKSEEKQRNRRKSEGLPECCPPPPLPKLTNPFRMLANLLQCEASLYVLKTVLDRALNLRSRCFSETQVHKVLHLIGYALRDEESGHYEFVAFSEAAHRVGIHRTLTLLSTSARVEAHRPLLKWVLSKMRKLLGGKGDEASGVEIMEVDEQEKVPNTDDIEKARRAKLAAERRSKLMAQMLAAQNNFITNNATLFEETATESNVEEPMPEVAEVPANVKALGVWGGGLTEPSSVCIMCQECGESLSSPLVLVAFVQYSTVLYRGEKPQQEYEKWDNAWLSNNIAPAPHVSSCGHTLHADCWKKYVDNVVDKENRRPYRLRQPAAFDVEKKEYLCPLCERLCNAALPLLPSPPAIPGSPPPLSEELFASSVQKILKHQCCLEAVHLCTESCEEMHCIANGKHNMHDMDTEDDDTYEQAQTYVMTHSKHLLTPEFLENFNSVPPTYDDKISTLVEDFAITLPRICGATPGPTSSLATLWRATSYSILSVNSVLSAENRPLLGELPARHKAALHTLIRLAAIVPSVWRNPRQIAHHALVALNLIEKSSPTTYYPFSALIPLVLSFPCVFSRSSGTVRPTNLARQITLRVFRTMLVRIIVAFSPQDIIKVESMEEEYQDCKPNMNEDLKTLVDDLNKIKRIVLPHDLEAEDIWEHIKSQCSIFLRCSCLFFHFLSDVEPPPELCVVGGDTWEVMCHYLNLPTTYTELLGTPELKEQVLYWANIADEYINGKATPELLVEPSEPPSMIVLPDDYSELMNVVSEFSCPNSEREDCKYPTMCLACGEILCSQSYCCQTEVKIHGRGTPELVGSVVAHALHCGGCVGAFLRVRDCELLLLAAPSKGSMTAAPYLDSYGETDQGLRRGNPLRLCTERYENLRKMWLNHSIHERIARSLDHNMLITTQWQNM